MSTLVKVHRIYIDRDISVNVALGERGIHNTDLRRFRRALADAVVQAFVAKGHRLEELKNFEVDWDSERGKRTNIMRARVQLIGDVKREEFESFSDVFLEKLRQSRYYQIEVVRGLRSLM